MDDKKDETTANETPLTREPKDSAGQGIDESKPQDPDNAGEASNAPEADKANGEGATTV